jgi:hypothetical protein
VYSVLSISNHDSIVTVDYNRTFAELAKAVLRANDHYNLRRDGVGACLCQAYMVTQSLRVNEDRNNPEHDIPMIEMQEFHGVAEKNGPQEQLVQCRQCLQSLDLASIREEAQWNSESAFVFCLSCKHEGYVRHDDDINAESNDEANDGSNDGSNDDNNDESKSQADAEATDEADNDPKDGSNDGFTDEPNDDVNAEPDDQADDQADDEPNDESDDETSSSISTTPQDVTHHTQLGHLILIPGSTASPGTNALYWLSPPGSQDKEKVLSFMGTTYYTTKSTIPSFCSFL